MGERETNRGTGPSHTELKIRNKRRLPEEHTRRGRAATWRPMKRSVRAPAGLGSLCRHPLHKKEALASQMPRSAAAPSSRSGERGCGGVCSTPLYSRPGARKRGGARSVHAVSALMIGAALEWSPRPHSNRALGATGSNTQSRLPPGRRAPPGNSRATAQRTRCTSGLVSGGRTATGSSPGCDSKMTAINVAATATVRSNLCPRTCMFGAARGEGPKRIPVFFYFKGVEQHGHATARTEEKLWSVGGGGLLYGLKR